MHNLWLCIRVCMCVCRIRIFDGKIITKRVNKQHIENRLSSYCWGSQLRWCVIFNYFLREWTILNLLTIVNQKDYSKYVFVSRSFRNICWHLSQLWLCIYIVYDKKGYAIVRLSSFYDEDPRFSEKSICVLQCCEIIVYPMDNLSINKFIIFNFTHVVTTF